jgi:hypothetical protein
MRLVLARKSSSVMPTSHAIRQRIGGETSQFWARRHGCEIASGIAKALATISLPNFSLSNFHPSQLATVSVQVALVHSEEDCMVISQSRDRYSAPSQSAPQPAPTTDPDAIEGCA